VLGSLQVFAVRHPAQSLAAKSNKSKWKIDGGQSDKNNSYYSQLRILTSASLLSRSQ
jgi:hypothetical protein